MRQMTSSTHGTFKRKIELKTYSREEYNSISTAHKGKNTPESSRALESRVAMIKAKKNSMDESLFSDEKPQANNRTNPALDRKGSSTRQSCSDT